MSNCECIKSELDIFAKPPIQRALQFGMWEEILPINAITGATIDFNIPGAGDYYFDPSSIYLHVQAKIIKSDNTNFSNTDAIAPCNNFLGALWKEVVVELNNVKVSSSNISYPYRSFIETVLNYGEDAKKSVLQSQLFYKDDKDHMESTELVTNATDQKYVNSGFIQRFELSKGSRPFDMYGKLHVDLFNQNRLMLNNVTMKVKLTTNSPNFCLIGKNTLSPKIDILKCALYVRRVRVSPEVMEGHIAAFRAGHNAIYPVRRVETRVDLLNNGISSYTVQSLKEGTIPKRIVIGMIANEVFSGKLDSNPYHFKHHKIKTLSLTFNGVVVPYKNLEFDFDKGEYIRGYHSLFTGVDKPVFSLGNNIERLDWIKGSTLFAFDLSPDLSCGDYFNIVERGKLRLDVSFSEGLSENINIITYMEFEDQIEITEERKVLYEIA